MHLAASSCNPAWHKSSTMVKSYLSRSYDNAISNLQLQARLPGASQHHSCFAACIRANAFCHSRLQTRKAGASHQIDQRSRSADTGTSTPQIRRCSEPRLFLRFLCEIKLSLQSCAGLIFQKCSETLSLLKFWRVWSTFCRPHLPKVLRTCQFLANQAPAAVLCTFCRQLLQIEPHTRGNETLLRQPQEPHYPAEKTQGFAPECFHPWIDALPNCCTSQLLDDGWLTWWCGWHDDAVDMMVGLLAMTIVRDLEVF